MQKNQFDGSVGATCGAGGYGFRLLATAMAAGLMLAAPVHAVNWDEVEGKDIPLFAPGQSSFEWVMTQSDHSGAGRFREGKNCRSCHDGEQKDIGNLVVTAQGRGAKLEPKPTEGKPGTIALNVKTAHDGENLLVQLQWMESIYGGEKMNPDNAARVTMMLDDGVTPGTKRTTCWVTCHDDAIGMANDSGAKLTKYVASSRVKSTRGGGGENYKSEADMAALVAKGVFIEYWQARLNQGQPAKPVQGHILDKRHEENSNLAAEAQYKDGQWTVVLKRPLQGAGQFQKSIAAGKQYNVGFAVHNNYTDHRFHHVSLEYTLSLDGSGTDLVAVKK